MNYNGFDVTSVGNATLQIVENKLVVSNIGDSGLDGVQIKTEGWKRCDVHLGSLSNLVNTRGVVRKATLIKNGLDQVFTDTEQIVFYYPPMDKVLIGFNNQLADGYRIVGRLNGEIVFDIPFEEIEPPEEDMPHPIAWIVAIVAAIVVAGAVTYLLNTKISSSKESKTKTIESGGKKETTTETKSKTEADPTPFAVVVNGEEYLIDTYALELEETITIEDPVMPEANTIRNAATIITASKIGEFTITSIEGFNN